MSDHYILSPGMVFTFLFVMLGPMKMLGPYAKATHSLSPEKLKAVSINAVIIATVSLLVGGFLGSYLLGNWGINVSVLNFTCGVIFLLTALIMILVPRKEDGAGSTEKELRPSTVSSSMIVTYYGMAVIVGLLTLSASIERTIFVVCMLLLVLFLDLLAMLYIRPIMGKAGAMTLQILGTVFVVLQAALAMQMIFMTISHLKADFPL